MSVVLYAFAVFAVAFLVRSLYRLRVPRVGSDNWEEVVAAVSVRENGGLPPRDVRGFLLSSGFWGDPRLMTLLLAQLPRRWMEELDRWFGGLVGGLFAVLVFLVGNAVGGLAVGALSGVVFAVSPSFGRRSSGVTDRPLGNLCLTFGFISVFLYLWTSMAQFAFFAVFLFMLAVLFNKFANQAGLFFGVLLSVLHWTPWFLVFFLAGEVVAVVVTFGKHWQTLKCYVLFMGFYRREFPKLVYGWVFKGFWSYFSSALKKLFRKDGWGALADVYHQPVVMAVVFNPFFAFFLLLGLMPVPFGFAQWLMSESWMGVPGAAWFGFFLVWVLSSFFLVVLTSIKQLRVFGSPERYFEYSLLPLSVVFSVFFVSMVDAGLLALFAGVVLFCLFVNFRTASAVRNSPANISDADSAEIMAWLGRQHGKNFIVLPYVLSYFVPYASENSVLFVDTTWGHVDAERKKQGKRGLVKVFKALEEFDPASWKANIDEFGIDYVLVWKNTSKDFIKDFNLDKYERVFDNSKFAVFSVSFD